MRALLSIFIWSFLFTFLTAQEQKESSLNYVDLQDEVIIDHFNRGENNYRPKKVRDPIQNVPIIETKPGASKVFLIDFDGHWLKDRFWLVVSANREVDSVELSPSSFSAEEIDIIVDIIYEDFIMLDINITTSEEVYRNTPVFSRQRLVVSPTYKWQDFTPGGVARLNSFGRSDSPAFSFVHYSEDPAWIAETCSHELGHTLGLRHDGRIEPREAYFAGSEHFAPIMGNGYYSRVSHWCKGSYNNADNFEDDYATMTQPLHGIKIREDDFSDDHSVAFPIVDPLKMEIDGLITTPEDIDWFAFSFEGGTLRFELDLIDEKPNLVSELILYDNSKGEIYRYNSWDDNHLKVEEELSAGDYYISIDGVGVGDPLDGGFSDYGSIGRYSLRGGIEQTSLLSTVELDSVSGSFYPNPSSGILKYVCTQEVEGEIAFHVFNGYGNMVREKEYVLSGSSTVDLDLSDLPVGVYFINVLFSDDVINERILISG